MSFSIANCQPAISEGTYPAQAMMDADAFRDGGTIA